MGRCGLVISVSVDLLSELVMLVVLAKLLLMGNDYWFSYVGGCYFGFMMRCFMNIYISPPYALPSKCLFSLCLGQFFQFMGCHLQEPFSVLVCKVIVPVTECW